MQTKYTKDKTKNALKNLKPRCGDCDGFNNSNLIDKQKGVCKENGKTKLSKPCRRFQPDIIPLKDISGTSPFELITESIAGMSDAQVRSLSTLLYLEGNNRRRGYSFGQKVYVRYRGRSNSNYVSNFMRAYVMSTTNGYLKVMSRDGRCTASFLLKNENQIFTEEEYDVMKQRMVRLGRIVDPDVVTLLNKVLQAEERYELGIVEESMQGKEPTIDQVFKGNKVRRRKTVVTDLSDIVRDIQDGIMVPESEVSRYRKVVEKGKPKRKRKSRVKSEGGTIDLTGSR